MVVDAQQNLDAAVIVHDVVLEALTPEMHVREQAEQGRIVRQSALHLHAEIVSTRRDDQCMIVQLQGDRTLLRQSLSEDYSDAGSILIRGAIGRVMHLEHEV